MSDQESIHGTMIVMRMKIVHTLPFLFYNHSKVTSRSAAWELNLRIPKLGGEIKGIVRHNVRRINI